MEQQGATLMVRGLVRRFARNEVVSQVDLDVGRGEVVALLGPNGAGKTTTLACIAGILRPSAGSISVNGSNNPAVRERRVAYVPEIPVVYDDLSPREHLAFVAAGRAIADPEDVIENAMRRTGVVAYADRPAGTFSKGMRQRLCLAGALVAGADVLLLDEPTTGLDPAAQDALGTIVCDLAAGGAAIVMSTHALAIAFAVATRIVVLVGGRLCLEAPRSLYADMNALRDDYVRITRP
jgi:ABC-2 type transport system ATP-binding protein